MYLILPEPTVCLRDWHPDDIAAVVRLLEQANPVAADPNHDLGVLLRPEPPVIAPGPIAGLLVVWPDELAKESWLSAIAQEPDHAVADVLAALADRDTWSRLSLVELDGIGLVLRLEAVYP